MCVCVCVCVCAGVGVYVCVGACGSAMDICATSIVCVCVCVRPRARTRARCSNKRLCSLCKIYTYVTSLHTSGCMCDLYGIYTAYCIWSVVFSFAHLNRWPSSVGLFRHVPLKRNQWNRNWRLRLNNNPNAIDCSYMICIHVIWYVYMLYDMYTCMICIHVKCVSSGQYAIYEIHTCGMATMSRLLRIIGLFCKKAL